MTQTGVNQSRPVEVRGLVKSYGARNAVDHVDLTVESGDVYGFLGPNGAGKTTTLRMLLGLIHRDAGSIRLFGRDPAGDPIAALTGVAGIIEEPRMYTYLSGRANLELLAALDRSGAGRKEIDEVLDLVELRDRAGDKVGEYSQGMRQRLGLASSLIRRPQLLLLDEPANGVDPAGIRFLRGLLQRLGDEGMTILLSSHLLSEVQEVCNRVAVINDGRIVHEGSLAELGANTSRYRLQTTDDAAAAAALARIAGVNDVRREPHQLSFTFAVGTDAVGVTRALADAGVGINELVREHATLEELFFRLTESPDPAAEVAA
ncbi:MAG: type transport system ATP-binding protein [Gaiellaceae bacterium]|jgi:ABC-2 type transport system ATP-binding protein|nr:type transport system ATP-binding protein [Gaiellaceae bacterium]